MQSPPLPPSLGAYFETFSNLLAKVDPAEVDALANRLDDAYTAGRLVFIVGNGGSGANASHLCEDLGKGTLHDFEHQRRLRVLSLTDNTPYLLAWGNDLGYEHVFAEQLKNLASEGDLLVAISGSGNSPNVLRAVEFARSRGMTTVAVTGYDGGRLRQISDHSVHVPSFDMGLVEAVHGVIFHYLVPVLHHRWKAIASRARARPTESIEASL